MARTDARSSAIMAAGTLVSRVLGFLKAILLTVALGALSTVGDVFETANTLPNLIYVLVAGGVFNAVLVPQIIKAAKAQDGGERYISKLVTITVTGIGLITAITLACAIPIINVMGSTWTPEQKELGYIFSFWCLPQIFFYGLYTVIGQVLNAKEAFGAFMWAPVLNNVVAIAALFIFIFTFGAQDTTINPPRHSVESWTSMQTIFLAGSATLGVALQAIVLFIPLRKLGLRLKPDFGWRGIGLREASRLAIWTLAAGAVSNLSYMYMTRIAASVVSARAQYADMGIQIPGLQAMNYASMLYSLPHGVIGISIATVLFNRMSSSAIADDSDSVIHALSHGMRTAGIATVFCALALIVLAGPVAVLFSGGDPVAATVIGRLIAITALGTPALTISFLYGRVLYARENARTPFLIQFYAAIVMVIMSGVASLLDPRYTVYALSLIFPVQNLFVVAISHYEIRRRLGYYGQKRIINMYARTTLAACFAGVIAAAVLWVLGGYNLDGFAWASKISAVITLIICGLTMLFSYVVMLKIFRVREADALFAPIAGKVKALARRGASNES